MTMAEISIIVPVYKVEQYLPRCVDSILAQTFTDFELILVDDGSPDNCGTLCDEYAARDSRVQVFHQKNRGVSAARNFGIEWALENSDSKWISFVDSDDWCHPQMLEFLYDATEKTKSSIAVCSYIETSELLPAEHFIRQTAEIVSTEHFFVKWNTNFVVPWGKLYKKEAFQKVRYPIGKRFEDEYTTYKVLFQFENIAFMNLPLYNYYTNPQGFMKHVGNQNRTEYFNAAIDQISFFQKARKIEAKKKVIRSYQYHLLSQYRSYQNFGESTASMNSFYQKLARRFCMSYWNACDTGLENKIYILWIAFPNIAKIYHGVKKAFRKSVRRK